MGRFLLGIGLLILLFAAGIWVAFFMDALHTPISDTLEKAAQQAVSGEWEQSISLARQAREYWEHHWHLTAAVADHTPMDEIDGLFAQADIYASQGAVTEFAAYCARLAKRIEAIEDAQGLTWWNLL